MIDNFSKNQNCEFNLIFLFLSEHKYRSHKSYIDQFYWKVISLFILGLKLKLFKK